MLRFVITATISLLIAFGAISKSHKLSSLLNHVTQDHVSHSHNVNGDHHQHHKHSDEESEKANNGENEHSHHFDLSLLTQVFTVENYLTDALISPLSIIEVLAPFADTSLLFCRYSFSIFRPPIA